MLYPFVLHFLYAGVHDFAIVDHVLKIADIQFISAAKCFMVVVYQGHDGLCVMLELFFEFSEPVEGVGKN